MLTGSDLIALVKGNPNLAPSQYAKRAGYVKTDDDGKQRVLVQQFYDALLAAQGLPIRQRGGRGRPALQQVTVQRNGIVVLGKRYTHQFGIQPGDTLEISLDDDAIHLVPVAA